MHEALVQGVAGPPDHGGEPDGEIRAEPEAEVIGERDGPRLWISASPEQTQLNYAQIILLAKDKHLTTAIIDPVQRALSARIPGATLDVRQLETSGGIGIPIAVRISGAETGTLRRLAEEAKALLRSSPGATRIRDDMAFLGIASLVGVIVSHVIVLFDFIEEAHAHGEPLEQALLDAGILRLRPVMITVGATVIALVPLAAHGGPLWEGLCYTQIGGLLVATVVSLLIVPVLYAIVVRDLKWVRWEPVEAPLEEVPPLAARPRAVAGSASAMAAPPEEEGDGEREGEAEGPRPLRAPRFPGRPAGPAAPLGDQHTGRDV
jgi:hypothetical protein